MKREFCQRSLLFHRMQNINQNIFLDRLVIDCIFLIRDHFIAAAKL